jgi:DNA-directed RNA polymerase specialized sigma24 family protein
MPFESELREALEEKRQQKASLEQENREKFRQLREEGLTNSEISERLKVGSTTLLKWAHELGLARKPGRPRGGGH